MTDLEKLNSEQRKAVTDTEGQVLVFAGAGSGKTRVLTHRIVYLIDEKHVAPWNILAITFTNKATNEMKERLNDMLGENSVWVSTFHSLCVTILHKYAEDIGFTKNFSIYDESASKRVLLRVLREKHLEEDDKDKYSIHISKAKNAGMNSDEYFRDIMTVEKDAMLICEVYDAYETILKESNAMDFDDLLMKCYELLKTSDRAREYYADKFKYVHVDEFQDTNVIQFELLKLLTEKWKNIFAVGDDDQSIYGWRGANVRNILEFDRTFPNSKVYKLEQNYRSSQQILDCANRLIKNNVNRSDKTLFSEKKDGENATFWISSTEYEETDRVVEKILSLKRSEGYLNSDFAILVRNNALTRLFETGLKRVGINYKIYGGFKFFDRKEILDVIAYMRLLVNDKDNEAVLRVINIPPRGIGDTTVEKLNEHAAKTGQTLMSVIENIDYTDLTPAIKSKVASFRDIVNNIKMSRFTLGLVDFAEELVNTVGFENYYKSTGKDEDANRWENIEEFLTFIEENYKKKDISVEDFLQTLALNNEAEEKEEDNADSVVIATMHAAKGLEFNVVFVVACEEGIIPSGQSIRERNGLEEERRVMYVALTRARERLFVSAVKGVRRKYNRVDNAVPSRFYKEAKGEPAIVLPEFNGSRFREKYTDEYESAIPQSVAVSAKKVELPKVPVQQQPKVYNTSSEGFKPGVKVEHKKYGKGTIMTLDGVGKAVTVSIAFPGLGIKKFALLNAPISLVKE